MTPMPIIRSDWCLVCMLAYRSLHGERQSPVLPILHGILGVVDGSHGKDDDRRRVRSRSDKSLPSERSKPSNSVRQEFALRAGSKLRHPMVLPTTRGSHARHLSEGGCECKRTDPCCEIDPHGACKSTICEREGICQQQGHPGRHCSCGQSEDTQGFEVAAQLLGSTHARHVPGIGFGTSRLSGGVDAHASFVDRAAGCGCLRVCKTLAGLHLEGGHCDRGGER